MESNWSHEPTVDGTLARTVSPMRSTLALQTRSWTPTTTQTFSVPCSLTEPWLESFLAVTARHRRPSPAGPEPLSCWLFLSGGEAEVSNCRLCTLTCDIHAPDTPTTLHPPHCLHQHALTHISAYLQLCRVCQCSGGKKGLKNTLQAHAHFFTFHTESFYFVRSPKLLSTYRRIH